MTAPGMTPTLDARELVTIRGAHSHNACYYGDHPDWLIAAARTRDADVLDESNFDATVRAMVGPSGEDWDIERSSHWAVGWVDYLIVRPGSDCETVALDIARRLEDYPVVDDELMSEYEWRDCVQAWEQEIRYRLHGNVDEKAVASLALDAHANLDVSEYPDFERSSNNDRDALAAGLRVYRRAQRSAS